VIYQKRRKTDRPLPKRGRGEGEVGQLFIAQSERKVLTASARVQFTVGTKLDTVDRAVMTFQNITFLAIDRVHADPFIRQTAGNETIL